MIEMVFYLAIFAASIDYALPSYGGVRVSELLILTCFLLQALFYRRNIKFQINRIFVVMFCLLTYYLIIGAIGVAYFMGEVDIAGSIAPSVRMAIFALFLICGYNIFIRNESSYKNFAATIFLITSVQFVYGAIQFSSVNFGFPQSSSLLWSEVDRLEMGVGLRFVPSGLTESVYGYAFLGLSLLSINMVLLEKYKKIAVIMATLSFFIIIFSARRNAAFYAIIILIAFLAAYRLHFKLIILSAILSIFIMNFNYIIDWVAIFSPNLSARFSAFQAIASGDFENQSASNFIGRLDAMYEGFVAFLDYPMGTGVFPREVMSKFPENSLLLYTQWGGILGGIIFASLYYAFFSSFLFYRKNVDRNLSHLSGMAFFSILPLFLYGLTGGAGLYNPSMALIWSGSALGLAQMQRVTRALEKIN